MATAADEEPTVWELGVGLSFISFPDYLGSDQRQEWLLPFPYVYYESQRFRVNRESISGVLGLSDRARLELSLSGSLPVDSHDNAARDGMSDLHPVIEVGPAFKYDLVREWLGKDRVILELPIRSAFAVNWGDEPRQIGWFSNPNIEYRLEQPAAGGQWTWRATFGPLFADDRYYRYFYGVAASEATADRPAYDTNGGFGGWRFSAGFSRRVDSFWYGGFVRYINVADAEFADSPLVKTNHSLIGGVAVAWIFAGSENGR